MARMSISLPDGLKRRMDAVGEPVNWSAVASRAFEFELGEIAKRKKEKDMQEVINRLKASKLKSETAGHRQGYEYGKRWASDSAEWLELANLYKMQEIDLPNWYERMTSRSSRWSLAEQIYGVIKFKGEEDLIIQEDAIDFWERNTNVMNPDNEVVRGFVDGALHIYDMLEDDAIASDLYGDEK